MEEVIVNALQVVEPRLRSLRVQIMGGVPLIYGDIGAKRLIPFPLMGDGMSRLLGIALAMTDAQDGILLIDEIENGIHHSVMPELWKTVADLAERYNAQIFATTHSIECVLAAYVCSWPFPSASVLSGCEWTPASYRLSKTIGIAKAGVPRPI